MQCVRVALALLQHDSLQLHTAATALEDLRSLVCQGDSQVGLRQYRYLFSLVCVRMVRCRTYYLPSREPLITTPDAGAIAQSVDDYATRGLRQP